MSRAIPATFAPMRPEVVARRKGQNEHAVAIPANGFVVRTQPVRRRSPTDVGLRVMATEWLTVVAAAVIAKLVYLDAYLRTGQPTIPFIVLGISLGFLVHVLYGEFGLYEQGALRAPSIQMGKLLGALVLCFLVLIGLLYLLKAAEAFSRGWMILWFALSAIMLCAVRSMALSYVNLLFMQGRIRDRVAIVGDRALAQRLRTHLDLCPNIEIGGIYDDRSDRQAISSAACGDLSSLIADARKGKFDQVIIALRASDRERIRATVDRLAVVSTELQLYIDPAPMPLPTRGCREVGNVQLQLVIPQPLCERAQLIKSGFDFAVASLALLLLTPLLAVIAIAIKLESPGPALFRQRRFGRGLEIFRIYKFRTMRVMEDGATIKQAEENDVRVTRVGRFLRRNSLDELPQLINVLKGEMSLVGPRPHALVHDEQYAQQIEHYSWRHRVKPGITGWAQVHGLRGETKTREEMRRRMEHDLYYIENWSIWLDLEIMFRTVITVLGKRAAH